MEMKAAANGYKISLGGDENILKLDYVCMHAQSLSCVWLFVCPWTVAHQAPLSTFQARILEWVAISYSRGLPHPGIETHISCIAGGFFTPVPPGKPPDYGEQFYKYIQCH